MTTTILTDIPEKITAGDSISWKRSIPTYSAADGWSLSYALTKADKLILIAGDTSGADHLISETAEDTKDWPPGEYGYQAYVSKGPDRHQIDEGFVEIRPNLAVQSSGFVSLPRIFTVRDALEAVLDMRATESQTSLAVGGRQISEMSHAEIQDALDRAKSACNIWKRRNRRDRGKATGSKVKAAFTDN